MDRHTRGLVDHKPTRSLRENLKGKLGLRLGEQEGFRREGCDLHQRTRLECPSFHFRRASLDPHGTAREKATRRRTRDTKLIGEIRIEAPACVFVAHHERARGADRGRTGHAAAYPEASAWGKV